MNKITANLARHFYSLRPTKNICTKNWIRSSKWCQYVWKKISNISHSYSKASGSFEIYKNWPIWLLSNGIENVLTKKRFCRQFSFIIAEMIHKRSKSTHHLLQMIVEGSIEYFMKFNEQVHDLNEIEIFWHLEMKKIWKMKHNIETKSEISWECWMNKHKRCRKCDGFLSEHHLHSTICWKCWCRILFRRQPWWKLHAQNDSCCPLNSWARH